MYKIILPKEKYRWFIEIALPLKESLNCDEIIINSIEDISNTIYDNENIYILFGCESLKIFNAKHYIVYQFEQINAKTDKRYHQALSVYINLMKNAEYVWEYSHVNIKVLENFGIKNVLYKPFGYSKCIENISYMNDKKDIDILWLGCIMNRRVNIINELKKSLKDYNLFFSDGVFDKLKTAFLFRSKIVLNIHMEEPSLSCLEVVRIIYCIANKCLVVSEYSGDTFTDNIFKPYIYFTNDFYTTCKYLLKNPEIIESKTQHAYNWLVNEYVYKDLL